MRRFGRELVVVIIGAAFLASVFGTCPCAEAATPAPEGHGCCPREPGLRATAADCCSGETVASQALTGPAGFVAISLLPVRTPLVAVTPVLGACLRVVIPSPSSHSTILRI
jgi:hypothetical protein